jgi:hypothetical protein
VDRQHTPGRQLQNVGSKDRRSSIDDKLATAQSSQADPHLQQAPPGSEGIIRTTVTGRCPRPFELRRRLYFKSIVPQPEGTIKVLLSSAT